MVSIIGFAVLMQFVVLIAILVAVNKATKSAREKADEFRASVIPVLEHSRELLQSTHSLVSRIEPRFDAAAADLSAMTNAARSQVARLESTANDLHERFRRQTERIDGMATEVLDRIDSASRRVSDAVRGPARRVSGVIAAARAFVETMGTPARRPTPQTAPEEHIPHEADVPRDKETLV